MYGIQNSHRVHRAGMKASIFIFLYHFCALGVLYGEKAAEGLINALFVPIVQSTLSNEVIISGYIKLL